MLALPLITTNHLIKAYKRMSMNWHKIISVKKIKQNKEKKISVQCFLCMLKYKVTVFVFSENRSSQHKRKKRNKLNAKKFLTQKLRKLEQQVICLFM